MGKRLPKQQLLAEIEEQRRSIRPLLLFRNA